MKTQRTKYSVLCTVAALLVTSSLTSAFAGEVSPPCKGGGGTPVVDIGDVNNGPPANGIGKGGENPPPGFPPFDTTLNHGGGYGCDFGFGKCNDQPPAENGGKLPWKPPVPPTDDTPPGPPDDVFHDPNTSSNPPSVGGEGGLGALNPAAGGGKSFSFIQCVNANVLGKLDDRAPEARTTDSYDDCTHVTSDL